MPRPPRSPLFPYTTLFRSGLDRINRSYGHEYGNHILRRLAGMLAGGVRAVDIVGRCGLDEFAVVLPETDIEEAERLADRDRKSTRLNSSYRCISYAVFCLK